MGSSKCSICSQPEPSCVCQCDTCKKPKKDCCCENNGILRWGFVAVAIIVSLAVLGYAGYSMSTNGTVMQTIFAKQDMKLFGPNANFVVANMRSYLETWAMNFFLLALVYIVVVVSLIVLIFCRCSSKSKSKFDIYYGQLALNTLAWLVLSILIIFAAGIPSTGNATIMAVLGVVAIIILLIACVTSQMGWTFPLYVTALILLFGAAFVGPLSARSFDDQMQMYRYQVLALGK